MATRASKTRRTATHAVNEEIKMENATENTAVVIRGNSSHCRTGEIQGAGEHQGCRQHHSCRPDVCQSRQLCRGEDVRLRRSLSAGL